ncbi:hypothetical protein PR003_g6468 [Phytophthora rubi]|uniref:RxLR effector protein n=1 Tax=Phytophthora rubi TaxID=129364 RepID=A0A6A4FPF7_9STRA|nr:hypothetical protein PR001_g6134 [Phytophthora rubi]KAE9348365.1 hypothetical protein PR003_g6468 [Phytophthora rubi]
MLCTFKANFLASLSLLALLSTDKKLRQMLSKSHANQPNCVESSSCIMSPKNQTLLGKQCRPIPRRRRLLT